MSSADQTGRPEGARQLRDFESLVARSRLASEPGITHEVDPDFLEHLGREAIDQPELPWEP